MDAREKANIWLDARALSVAERDIIENYTEQELEEAFYKDLEFGTGGLRGIMGIGSNRINRFTVGMATQGFANYLKQEVDRPSVVVAHDSRNNSKELARITAEVFSANGLKVYLFEDLRPTPELSFAIRHLNCNGGVVLTASHNPKEYNGYKAYWSDGAQLISPHDKNVISEVQKIQSIDEVNFEADDQLIELIGETMDHSYLEMVKALVPEGNKKTRTELKIVYSSIHGTGITLIPRVLDELGFGNVHLVDEQKQPDGNFPTVVYPNPEEEDAMSMALQHAKEIDGDIVMATDPDSDRVGIAVRNTKGEFQLLNGNQTGALLVFYLLNQANDTGFKGNEFIAKTIVTTELIRDISSDFGVNCYDTLTGFKYIAALIKELEGKEKFIGGGEESYGYMIGDKVRDKDAVASCVVIAEMTAWAKDQGKSLFELLIEISEKYGLYYESLKSITKPGKEGAQQIKEMMEKFRSEPPQTLAGSTVTTIIDYLEGNQKNTGTGESTSTGLPTSNVLQYLTEDGTKVSVRPSGTEPKIKFYFSVKGELGNNSYYEGIENLKSKTHKLLIDLGL